MFLLLETALDAPPMTISMDHPFGHVDERRRVHLPVIDVTGGHVRMIRLEHYRFRDIHVVAVPRVLLACFNLLLAADVREKSRVY